MQYWVGVVCDNNQNCQKPTLDVVDGIWKDLTDLQEKSYCGYMTHKNDQFQVIKDESGNCEQEKNSSVKEVPRLLYVYFM